MEGKFLLSVHKCTDLIFLALATSCLECLTEWFEQHNYESYHPIYVNSEACK